MIAVGNEENVNHRVEKKYCSGSYVYMRQRGREEKGRKKCGEGKEAKPTEKTM